MSDRYGETLVHIKKLLGRLTGDQLSMRTSYDVGKILTFEKIITDLEHTYVPHMTSMFHDIEHNIKPVTIPHAKDFFSQEDRHKTIESIYTQMFPHIVNGFQKMEDLTTASKKGSVVDQLCIRIYHASRKTGSSIGLIHTGYHDGLQGFFDIVRILPRLYIQKYGELPDRTTYQTLILENAKKILLPASTLQMQVLTMAFRDINISLGNGELIIKSNNPYKILLEEAEWKLDENNYICASEELCNEYLLRAEEVSQKQYKKGGMPVRIGCPAFHTFGGEKSKQRLTHLAIEHRCRCIEKSLVASWPVVA